MSQLSKARVMKQTIRVTINVRQSYECLAQGKLNPFLGPGGADKEMNLELRRLSRYEKLGEADDLCYGRHGPYGS